MDNIITTRARQEAISAEFSETGFHGHSLVTAVVLFTVLVISAAYAGMYATRGWIPNDDGTLADGALRVLNGQLPHRDFVETYTGGLDYFHAAAFRLFGINLLSLRWAVLFAFLASVPAIFYIVGRFVSPIVAGAITLLAIVWGYPNYPAAMPSWYNLFLALLGTAALIRHVETGGKKWLFVAGICGGLSIIVKVVGLYYVAAVLLFLIYREQSLMHGGTEVRRSLRGYGVFVTCALLAFLGVIVWMMSTRLGSGDVIHFALPATCLAIVLIWRELERWPAASFSRFLRLFSMGGSFLAGVGGVVGAFLIPYARSGALSQLWNGVFFHVVARTDAMGVLRPPGAVFLVFVVPVLFLLAVALSVECKPRLAVAVSAGLAAVVIGATRYAGLAWSVWYSASMFTPVIVALGAGTLLKRSAPALEKRAQYLMLLLCIAAICGLVQYPLAAPIYFCYFAPLTIIATAGVISVQEQIRGKQLIAAMLASYFLYGVLVVGPSFIYGAMDVGPKSRPRTRTLRIQRGGGLRVQSEMADFYENVTQVVQQHALGRPIVAGPECTELYFLSGLPNATGNDAALDGQEVSKTIPTKGTNQVIINNHPFFPASEIPHELKMQLVSRFPHSVSIGKFEIRWRE